MAKFLNQVSVKIDGTNMDTTFYDAIEEVVVDSTLDIPSMCSVKVHDNELAWADSATLAIGKTLAVTFIIDETGGTAATTPTFEGEIISIEPKFSSEGETSMRIRAYDKSHRLHRGRKTRTFLQVKDSDVVSTIAGEAGLTTEIDATTVTHDFLIQYNQTNMEFLQTLAERVGHVVFCASGKLYFKKGDAMPATEASELKFADNLRTFEPRLTAGGQAEITKVLGWDVTQKIQILSQGAPAAALNQGGMSQTGGAAAVAAFSSATESVAVIPVVNASEAALIQTRLNNDIGLEAMQAEGTCFGSPSLLAGRKVKISNVGTRFSGYYNVTAATHVYTADGYETHFTVAGRHANTFAALVGAGAGAQAEGLVTGVVPAVVTNNNDTDNLGRVKVKYAWLGEIESNWARIATPFAGASRGFQYIPEINDEVLVAFEHGNMRFPYIIGVLWNGVDKPPLTAADAVADGKVITRVIKSRLGHTITISDKDDLSQISVKTVDGHEVILLDGDGKDNITVKDKTGKNSIVIKSQDNSMTIITDGDFSVTAKGKITLKSTGDMSMTSDANAKVSSLTTTIEGTTKSEVKAPQVSVSGDTKAEVKGLMVSINGSAQSELKGGGMVTIQGGIVKIN
jgi:uncharacterized protein involved in type VI secretion and phage assembly